MIDTHALYKHFLAAGFSERKSEVLTESILQYSGEEKANKIDKEQSDIKTSISLMQHDIANIKENMATKVELARLEAKMESQKSELIKWMTGLIITSAMLPHLLKWLL